ncbi:radical SAM protein [Rubrobacter radiotolerans]|uniref:radical SAM protein n=1 Tax=Rubrobacter radiotolerans TaxID=42256 RepID=UPI000A06BE5F
MDRCNLRCQCCMPEDIKSQDKSHILTLEEILLFAEACLQLGVTQVRVTGGEPLVLRGVARKDTPGGKVGGSRSESGCSPPLGAGSCNSSGSKSPSPLS